MRIIRTGVPFEPADAWRQRLWRCVACGTVAQFDSRDSATHHRARIFIAGEIYDTEHVWGFCPACDYNRAWAEHGADDEEADQAREADGGGSLSAALAEVSRQERRQTMALLDPNWKVIPITDEEWAEAGGELLDADHAKCPECGALIFGGICVNACHLAAGPRRRFREEMDRLSRRMAEHNG